MPATRFGTDHFVFIADVHRYYGEQEGNKALAEGRVFLGPPTLKEGEKLLLDKAEGRYFIEEPNGKRNQT